MNRIKYKRVVLTLFRARRKASLSKTLNEPRHALMRIIYQHKSWVEILNRDSQHVQKPIQFETFIRDNNGNGRTLCLQLNILTWNKTSERAINVKLIHSQLKNWKRKKKIIQYLKWINFRDFRAFWPFSRIFFHARFLKLQFLPKPLGKWKK